MMNFKQKSVFFFFCKHYSLFTERFDDKDLHEHEWVYAFSVAWNMRPQLQKRSRCLNVLLLRLRSQNQFLQATQWTIQVTPNTLNPLMEA